MGSKLYKNISSTCKLFFTTVKSSENRGKRCNMVGRWGEGNEWKKRG